MNSYIQLKAASDSQYWQLKVLHDGKFEKGEQPLVFERTANNKLSFTQGQSYLFWSGLVKLYTSPPANYCSVAQYKKWTQASVPADRVLSFIDHFGVTRNVVIVSKWDPSFMSPMWDGTGTYRVAPIELYQA